MAFKPPSFRLLWIALTLTFAPLHFGQAIEFGSQLRIDCPDAPLSDRERNILGDKEEALRRKRNLERELLVLDRKEQVFLAHIRRVLETSAAEQVIEHLQDPSRRFLDYDTTPTGCSSGPSSEVGRLSHNHASAGVHNWRAQDLGVERPPSHQGASARQGNFTSPSTFCLVGDLSLSSLFPTEACANVRFDNPDGLEEPTHLLCNTWSLFVRDQGAVSPEICQARVFHQSDSVTSSQIKNCQRALAEVQKINKEVALKRTDLQALNSLLDQLLDEAELARIQTEADCADGRCPTGARSRRSGSSLGSVIRASDFCSGR